MYRRNATLLIFATFVLIVTSACQENSSSGDSDDTDTGTDSTSDADSDSDDTDTDTDTDTGTDSTSDADSDSDDTDTGTDSTSDADTDTDSDTGIEEGAKYRLFSGTYHFSVDSNRASFNDYYVGHQEQWDTIKFVPNEDGDAYYVYSDNKLMLHDLRFAVPETMMFSTTWTLEMLGQGKVVIRNSVSGQYFRMSKNCESSNVHDDYSCTAEIGDDETILGLEKVSSSEVPEAPPSNPTAVLIAAGEKHICLLNTEGQVTCSGNSSDGRTSPPSSIADSEVIEISLGERYGCALHDAGNLTCWGLNTYGQASAPPTKGKIAHVSAGGEHTCAIDENGQTFCWGNSWFF